VIVLHPHRPEPSKGLPQTIEVVDLLVKRHGVANLKVLVPRWLEAGLAPEIREFVQAMQQEIAQRGLVQHFIFHDWAPQRLMPQYFSLGGVTLAAQIIAERRRTPPATLAYLREHYGVQRQVAAYADAIVHAQRRDPLTYRYQPLADDTRYQLAPWCYRWEGGFYHDFLVQHRRIEPLAVLLDRFGDSCSAAQAHAAGVDGALLDHWLREGYVVPQP
jgi:hypothetical protein